MHVVIGLGNPGKQYGHTRHNIGFMAVDRIAEQAGARWETRANWSVAVAKTNTVLYVKPLTYMNLSGAAVAKVCRYYKVAPTDVLVIYDDKDLPFGTVRFRAGGSSGGHRGMQSVIEVLATRKIVRLKIGIAPTDPKRLGDTADFVLARFTPGEQKQLPEIIEQTNKKLSDYLTQKVNI